MKRYLKGRKAHLFVYVFFCFLYALSLLLMSLLMGEVTAAAQAGDFTRIGRMALIALVYMVFDSVMEFSHRYARDKAIQGIDRDLRRDLVNKISSLPWEEKRRHDNGYYTSMVVNDVATVDEEYLLGLAVIFLQALTFALTVPAAFALQPVLTAIMLAVSFVTVLLPKLTEKPLQRTKERAQAAKSAHLSALGQVLDGFFLLKIFNGFSGIGRAYGKANDTFRDKEMKFRKTRGLLWMGSTFCSWLVYMGSWALGAFFVAGGSLTLPGLVTFTQLIRGVSGPVMTIADNYAGITAAAAVKKRLLDFLDAPTDEADRWGAAPLDAVETVKLSHLTYAVDGKELLKGVDLTLRKGDRVALLGESGSGKSTLLKVLSAMQTGEGNYTLNGRPFRDYAYGDFRRQVTLLEQKSFVFDASIRDNVTLFTPRDGGDGAILAILQKVGLGRWLEERGGSLDAVIGRDHQAMSGGEERRLDLARTLYRGASLVLMDEPTTGLDPDTRAAVEETISSLDCDILVVAVHDPSPQFLSRFDRVITMKDGVLTQEVVQAQAE